MMLPRPSMPYDAKGREEAGDAKVGEEGEGEGEKVALHCTALRPKGREGFSHALIKA